MRFPGPLNFASLSCSSSTNRDIRTMVKTPETAAGSSSNAAERRNNEPKYKGARKRKWGKYVSEIRLPNSRERIWLGSYDTAEKAARAFDAALFCLRGHSAKLNFPDDPPLIAGGQKLSPAQIQAVAQHYANIYSGGSSHQPQREDSVEVPEDTSLSLEGGGIESIDWSFLDMLDSNYGGNAGHDPDFGFFHEPGEMCMPVGNENEYEDYDEHEGNVPYLWSF